MHSPNLQHWPAVVSCVTRRRAQTSRRTDDQWNVRGALPLLIVLVMGLTLPGLARTADTADVQLARLLEEAWQVELREDPLLATRTGDRRFDDRLPSVSQQDCQRRYRASKQLLDRLNAIDRAQLSRDGEINYDIFSQQLRNRLTEHELETYLIPITNREGFHVSFPELPRRAPLESLRDFENYLSRLRGFERYTQQHIELMRLGIERGLVLPAVVLEGYRELIEPHVVNEPEMSRLFQPLEQLPDRFSPDQQRRLRQLGRQAIRESVVPGYRQFLDFMADEYVPAARGSIGASALPRGRELYRHRVRRFTTLDLTPDEVHQIGLKEVKRIRQEMDGVIRESGFAGEFAEFVEFLRSDPRFYATSPSQLMKEVSYTLKRMDGQLPRLFKNLPRTPYGIREIPAYIAPKTTTAYYVQPAGDGTRAGFYYVNTFDLKSRPLYEIEALSLHEAVPGHHLQLALQQELTDLPQFRRFSEMTVFVEGWALYAERLGLEVGFYEDPYDNFGRLSYEMWRACRLVVDTGIHYFGWTRQQAIDHMAENTSLALHNIEAEVDRYIAWPGQALAYKIGELKIRQLRSFAEEELDDAFDIREFHQVVLGSGAVPLSVLEETVKRYVQSARKAVGSENREL